MTTMREGWGGARKGGGARSGRTPGRPDICAANSKGLGLMYGALAGPLSKSGRQLFDNQTLAREAIPRSSDRGPIEALSSLSETLQDILNHRTLDEKRVATSALYNPSSDFAVAVVK